MKTNTMMRLASVLLVAVLLSTCAIAGTYAKYVTSDSGKDSARVAKWGVKVEISDDLGLFAEEYGKHATNVTDTTITNTVKVDTTGPNLVAPGTDGSIEFKVSGTPEVAVNVQYNVKTGYKDVVIPKDTVVAGTALEKDYNPVVFTLATKGTAEDGSNTVIKSGTLAEVLTEFDGLDDEYPTNTKLDVTYILSWKWDFDANGAGTNDVLDTFLGNAAVTAVDGVSTVIDFEISISVTQID